jgi:hypothetical protein
LYVGTGGTICVEMGDGTTAALNVPDGSELHIRVKRVRATLGQFSTTATNIFAYL